MLTKVVEPWACMWPEHCVADRRPVHTVEAQPSKKKDARYANKPLTYLFNACIHGNRLGGNTALNSGEPYDYSLRKP